MALFLNTSGFNYWIPKLIREAESELVIIVPYIRTSNNIINALKEANHNNVEITLVYRENKLCNEEKKKLLGLDRLTLLHQPNVHCKTYYNGNLLIIGSMNLYEYSEKNNREMGILLNKYRYEKLKSNGFGNSKDDKNVFLDAKNEIKEIITSAHIEKMSKQSKESNFVIEILKSPEEKEAEYCNELNTYFLNKKFKPIEVNEHVWDSKCKNFYDKVDVTFQTNRITVKINMESNQLRILYNTWMNDYDEFEFKNFKYYWNYFENEILIYPDRSLVWDQIETDEVEYALVKDMLTTVIYKFRKISGK